MPNAMTRWFARRRAAKNKKEKTNEPLEALPRLPSDRPVNLTPKPSCESLVSSTIEAKAQSPFFTKLPREIRRAILIEAFGNQTVHMDLIYNHPPLPRENVGVNKNDGHWRINIDKSLPKQWMWRSSVCTRDPPVLRSPADQVQPAEDLCRTDGFPYNVAFEASPSFLPKRRSIGVMGWLLSCRQAYVEGIEVLYSTNTIHTASKEMLMCVDQILLPQRLASIRSVELLWDFEPFPKFSTSPPRDSLWDFASFRSFLDKVPSMFPNVRNLHISLQGELCPTKIVDGQTKVDNRIERVDNVIMKPVDSMARKLGPHIQQFSVGIPSSLYKAQRNRAREAGEQVEQAHCGKVERHWRPLNGSASRSGYWVRLGQKDFSIPFVCTMGEGGYGGPTISHEDWVFYR